MKRILTGRNFAVFGVLMLLALLAGLVGCSGKGEKLYVYNWTYYIPEEVVRAFEKEMGVKVVYDVFASNEEMFAKLKAGGAGYDITFPSGDYVSIMAGQGMLEKIDHQKVPNLAQIDPQIREKLSFDPEQEYSVPFMMGAAGVVVNKKKVSDYEKSWNIFDRPDLKGRMTLLDDMREVLGAALRIRGYSVNSHDPKELAEAKEIVRGWRNQIVKFDAETFGKGFAAGEFFVVHAYAENVYQELDEAMKEDVEFFIPREGGSMYMDCMVILKDGKNKDLAHEFINFIHRPEIYAQIVDFLETLSINVGAREFITIDPIYNIEDLVNCEFLEDLGTDVELYDRIWQEIRVGK